ncbi:MAG: hypothetical protein AAF694_10805 [Bacteroidota bacterium]
MLCLLFTREKLFCGFTNQESKLLSIHGKTYIELGSTSLEEALRQNLIDIKAAYNLAMQQNGSPQPEKIQVAVASPKHFPHKLNGFDEGSTLLKEAIEEVSGDEFDVIAAVENSFALMLGLNESVDTSATMPRVVLDALDQKVSVYYEGLNGKAAANGKSKVVFLDKLGMEPGRNHVLKRLSKAFEQAGLTLDQKDMDDLRQQVRNPMRNGTFTLVKSNDLVSVTAKANLSEERFAELLTQDHTLLAPFLDLDSLEELGIEEVVILGKYLKLPVIQDYLKQDLKLESKLRGISLADEEEELETMLRGLKQIGVQELSKRLEEERKRQQEAEKKRLQEIQLQADRDALMVEIREKCIDSQLQAEYEETYIERGNRVGLPKEVVLWNIQEALRIARLAPNMPKETELFASTGLIQARTTHLEPTSPLESHTAQQTQSTEEESFPLLTDLFEVRGVLPDSEFNTKKVIDKKSKETFVLRLLSGQRQDEEESVDKFNYLYEKELTYYGQLSDVRSVKEGLYYLRPFYERNTLKEYVRKTELFNKRAIEELGSNELKLILQVMKEVNDLPISHADINEHNILVLTKRRWRLHKDMTIKIVGFTSDDITKEEMEKQFHTMWERLLGEGFYKDFRNKFSL